jgi:hypothetical protein
MAEAKDPWHPFLGDKLPRGPDYRIIGERQVRYLDSGRGEKPVKFLRICDQHGFCSISFPHIEFRQFS